MMITLLSGTYTFADLDWQSILGGFGLFLFGIKFMGDGLKAYAGDKLRDFIDRYTTKVWMGVLVGIVATILVQSSSASTAITIGFVRAGLMRLDQAVGIILGANIGTTTTAFLVGLKVEKYSARLPGQPPDRHFFSSIQRPATAHRWWDGPGKPARSHRPLPAR